MLTENLFDNKKDKVPWYKKVVEKLDLIKQIDMTVMMICSSD